MQTPAHGFHVDILHGNAVIPFRQFMTFLMVKVLSLVPHFFMAASDLDPLLFVIPAPLPAMG